jgi:hypothetical protein
MDFIGFQGLVTPLQQIVQSINALNQKIAVIRATSAQFIADATGVILTPSSYWTAVGTVVTLTDAATVAVDFSTGINFTLTATSGVGATRALGNPTNTKVGQTGFIEWIQDGAGGRALTYGTHWVSAGGTATLAPVTTSAALNVFYYTVISSTQIVLDLDAGVVH